MEIEINGVRYESIPDEGKKTKKAGINKRWMSMASVFTLINPYFTESNRKYKPSKPLPTSDLVKEFELIQAKQSKLSRAQRDQVVNYFHKIFREVK